MKKVFDRIKATFIIDQLHFVPFPARTFFQPGSETVLTWPPSLSLSLSFSFSETAPGHFQISNSAVSSFSIDDDELILFLDRWRRPIRASTLSFWTPSNAILIPCWPLIVDPLYIFGSFQREEGKLALEHGNRDSTINTSINTRVDKGDALPVGNGETRESPDSLPSPASIENRDSRKNQSRKRVESLGGKTGRRDWFMNRLDSRLQSGRVVHVVRPLAEVVVVGK